MRKLLFAVASLFMVCALHAQQNATAINPVVITGQLIKITKPLKDFTPDQAAIPDVKVRDENGIIGSKKIPRTVEYYAEQQQSSDNAVQKDFLNRLKDFTPNNAITSNFNGIGYQPLNPPDPTLCVGPNHIIQMVNGSSGALFKVFDKTGGQVVAQTYLDAITGKGGLGDPIALYDQLADRYVLTEFNNKSETTTEGLTFAVSQTNNPAGAWYVYFFSTGTSFPDYPKFSVWPDAYYATTNDFANASSYSGSSVFAFDRSKMLVGNATATMQKITLGTTSKHFSMSPVCLEGTSLPPSGTGGLIAYMSDNAWTTSTTDVDSIGLFEFKVNFTTPSLTSVLTKSSLAVTAFKSDICTATRGQCISQSGNTVKVEALHQKIMNQPIYRNFAGYEGIVLSHVVDKGTNISGVRWYELRKTTGNWGVYQQSTYAPDNTHRWLPGICYDAAGNIGLAYNVSSAATGVNPGARYTGRKECDPLNTMTYAESVIIAGTAANGSTRYGDYNQLVADPDGVRFWFTCEYNAASTWSTRIASFTLDNCTPALCGDPTGLAASAITNTTATVSWTAVANAVSYDVDYQVTGAGTWTNAATATATTSVNLSGLTQGTAYSWRVRATCAAGSGNYTTSSFTTTAPCGTPTGLVSSAVTSSTATVSWSAVSGATSYAVDYKLNASGTWTSATASTAATSVNLSGLTASSLYDWRVSATCASGTSAFGTAQFTTTAVNTCVDILEPNGTSATAGAINVSTNYTAQIASNGDNDYYRFNNTTALKKIRVTLNTLPADYDMKLYRPNGALQATSQNAGTTAEKIIYNPTANNQVGTYRVYVYGYAGAFSNTQCYTLRVDLSATNFTSGPEDVNNKVETVRSGMKVFPVPATNAVTISFDAFAKGNVDIVITNQLGQEVLRKQVNVDNGVNFNTVDVSKLKAGIYFVKVNNGKQVESQKLIINR
ncbi:T9SS type A sorting domain-containing protein [Ferruginibacter sp.]|nr:fibronectin type III domain-containing protein [Ferruginibacter sp.]